VKFAIVIIVIAMFLGIATVRAANVKSRPHDTYQGKSIRWWANHAVKARKDANTRRVTIQYLKAKTAQTRKDSYARLVTIKRLKTEMAHDPTIEECVRLATIAYPSFTEARAWQIIYHESWTSGKQFAKNRHSTASGLYQFLTSTFASTPYGRAGMSIWSPCASSLAAGWMHENGRGGEWAIG
jgi:hypothetical protein